MLFPPAQGPWPPKAVASGETIVVDPFRIIMGETPDIESYGTDPRGFPTPYPRAREAEGALPPEEYQAAHAANRAHLKEIQRRASHGAATQPAAATLPVLLKVQDRSGDTSTSFEQLPIRPRRRPEVTALFSTASPATATSSGGQELIDPIYADPVDGNGNGTELRIEPKVRLDARARAVAYTLEIGHPWQTDGVCKDALGKKVPAKDIVLPEVVAPGPVAAGASARARTAAKAPGQNQGKIQPPPPSPRERPGDLHQGRLRGAGSGQDAGRERPGRSSPDHPDA